MTGIHYPFATRCVPVGTAILGNFSVGTAYIDFLGSHQYIWKLIGGGSNGGSSRKRPRGQTESTVGEYNEKLKDLCNNSLKVDDEVKAATKRVRKAPMAPPTVRIAVPAPAGNAVTGTPASAAVVP